MKERERKKLSLDDMAGRLGIPAEKYQEIEAGSSPAETWGTRLANIAIQLETPTSRLLAESGKSADTRAGQAGELIHKHREKRGKTPEQMAEALGISSRNTSGSRPGSRRSRSTGRSSSASPRSSSSRCSICSTRSACRSTSWASKTTARPAEAPRVLTGPCHAGR